MRSIRTSLAALAVITAAIAVPAASAAPALDSVQLERLSPARVAVTVVVSNAARPQLTVRVGARAVRLRAIRSSARTPGTVVMSGSVAMRAAVGHPVFVRVRICDGACITAVRRVRVGPDGEGASLGGPPPAPSAATATAVPVRASAITMQEAIDIALGLAEVPDDAAVEEAEPARDPVGGWKVELRGTDGTEYEVLIDAEGNVVRVEVEDEDHADDDDDALPPGAITAEQAMAAAVAEVGVGAVAVRVERTDDDGAVWEVTVMLGDVEYEVLIDADGNVVRVEVEDAHE